MLRLADMPVIVLTFLINLSDNLLNYHNKLHNFKKLFKLSWVVMNL